MSRYEGDAARLKAMSHPARLRILDMLRGGEICVCHIENALSKRQAYVSQQLMVLRDAGLVSARKDGLLVYYRLADAQTARLLDALYGPPADHADALDGCACPACNTVPLAAVAGEA